MKGAVSLRGGDRRIVAGVTIVLLITGAVVVYQTGGTAFAWPYVMFFPMLVAAAWMGIPGGVATGVAAGFLLGPFMPLDVSSGEMQPLHNWLTRLGFFTAFGALAGTLFMRLEKAAERLHRTARTDHESGLPNQFALQEDLIKERPAKGRLMNRDAGLILLRAVDLADALEAIGADATGQIFPEMGRRFERVDPRVKGVYRFSNSEIAVLLVDVDEKDLESMSARLRDAAEEHVSVRGIPVRLEMVAGGSRADEDWIDGEALIRQARIALFAAIEADHTYQLYLPILERGSSETVRLIARLSTALDAGELQLWYQPKLDLKSGRPLGCEGLIRWVTADGGVVLPAQFMPKVERTSLIKPVTQFVARTACAVAVCPDCRPVSINFSVRNLFDPGLLNSLQELLSEHGVEDKQLEIEITERALIRNPVEAERLVEKLREMGVGVSIDDFGTGYSSFDFLRRLPVTGLKVDRVFVRDVEGDNTARELLRCLIEAGHAMDLTVTAEGVETRKQHDIVRELGCDLAQGFLYAKPMPLEDVRSWMRAPQWTDRQ